MPENVNWDAVFQSIADTWTPVIGIVAIIIVVAVIVLIVKKRKNRSNTIAG